MRTRRWWLLVVLAGCANGELAGPDESDVGWSPDDDADIGPVYLLVSEERLDNPPYAETTSARVQVFDVSQPGGGGEHAAVLETLVDIEYPVLSPSHRWAAIATGLLDFEPFHDIYLIDFVGSPLEPARPIERPAQGYFYDFWFAADDSGLATSFVPTFDDDRNYLYYVPLLESGPLMPIEVEMPDERLASSPVGLSEDGRWLVFVANDPYDDDAGIYVSEIIGGQPSPALLANDVSSPFLIGEQLHVAGGAVIFETYESVGAEEPSLHRLHRIDLETLEMRTLTLGEPEPDGWCASEDGSRVLYLHGQVVDYIEIVDGEPQPALLGLGDDEAHPTHANFLATDGRYGVAKLHIDESDSYFWAWYDFEGPNPTEPVDIEFVSIFGKWAQTWAVSAKLDGSLLMLNPSLGFVDVVELPPPWHAIHVRVYDENTRAVIEAIEGPPSHPSGPFGPADGAWTLRMTDEPGPPVRFDHPLEPNQHLPLYFNNIRHVPSSERHFYQVIDGDLLQSVYDVERRTIWENDGLGARTVLTELEGYDFAHLVVAPQWQASAAAP